MPENATLPGTAVRAAGLVALSTLALTLLAGAFLCAPARADDASAASAPLPQWLRYQDPYAAKAQLGNAHMAHAEIIDWVQQSVTDALTLPAQDFNQKALRLRPRFSETGWAAYGRFLGENGLYTALREKNADISCVVSGPGQVTAHGPRDGAYHWTVRLPLMLTTGQTASAIEKIILVDIVRHKATPEEGAPDSLENSIIIENLRVAAPAPDTAVPMP